VESNAAESVKFNDREVAQERLKIIQFYDEPGETKTKKYFGVNRKTVWIWKHKLVTARGQLAALIPKSTRGTRMARLLETRVQSGTCA
jgi:hypothetical protein